jgi:ppGpp synthetase/RelA/SpoT-type nucleotidyltranferase
VDDAQQDAVRRALSDYDDDLELAMQSVANYLNGVRDDLTRRDSDFHCRWIECRVKKAKSVIRTLDSQRLPADRIWELDDLLGARAIVVTKSMANKLRRAILNTERSPVWDLRDKDIDDPDAGYRAIHIKGRCDGRRRDYGFEIQIRTELEDAWAVVSRNDFYEGERQPRVLEQVVRLESRHLSAVDEAFDMILAEVRKADLSATEPTTVADQTSLISAVAPPPEQRRPEEPSREGLRPEGLTAEDQYILANPISPARTDTFLEDFVRERGRAATTEMLFRRAGAFELYRSRVARP